MPFILLEFASPAAPRANPIGQDLSEAPENRLEGHPEMSDRPATGSTYEA
jgi:hypothetical protein